MKGMSEKVRHRTKPAEPFAQPNAFGRITRTREDGPLRITPAAKGVPAQAYVAWERGDEVFYTWERLSDLIPAGRR
ncbi:hypothetical protein [Mycolicibacterium phlei]|uniref:hypothetical protein n=1 Tax=Mycolicibacterium phlei TaxID=1771 RepID=UPI0002D444B6|nr:hypothetical protein [Mycolicibacterium phlei]MBF4194624.1 hypothetical protein [Mycolicibacterium phlei]